MSSFEHVSLIRRMDKRCGIRASDVLSKIAQSGILDHRFTLEVEGQTGILSTVSLRWCITSRKQKPITWSMAILQHDERIDGIDHEARVNDHRGHKCSGWHRHMWDSDELHARRKECLDDFGTFKVFPEFLRDGCKVLGIIFEEEETPYETTGMLFA